jgi:ATP-dependent Lhr-like helicase
MQDIKQLLPHAYYPFFQRFARLTQVQIKVIPEVLAGKNIVVISEAATGKTEAAVAPVAERMCRKKHTSNEHISVLYISPTKALAKDIFRRINEPLAECRIRCSLKTGDRPGISVKNIPHFLVTTIESLDSVLCRSPMLLSCIDTVILDEIHLVDGTYRGDQLRCLLRRIILEKNRTLQKNSERFQGIAMSATLLDPVAAGTRYFPVDRVIDVHKPREIKTCYFQNLSECIEFARKKNLNKMLAFANSRRKVEETKEKIADLWNRDRVMVHHGSLSVKERKSVEHAMQEWEWGICIATTTLEIGVDIGKVDAVILLEPPVHPSAFIQRVGRSMREGGTLTGLCIAESDGDQSLYREFIDMGQRGLTEEKTYVPDLSVCVQQIFSMAFRHPAGVSKAAVFEVLSCLTQKENTEIIIQNLIQNELIREQKEKIFASTELMEMGEKGRIHSNIMDMREYQVKDAATGQMLGRISFQAETGATFPLAGKTFEVIEIKKGSIIVQASSGSGKTKNPFLFRTSRGAFRKYLPEELK